MKPGSDSWHIYMTFGGYKRLSLVKENDCFVLRTVRTKKTWPTAFWTFIFQYFNSSDFSRAVFWTI